MEIQIDSQDDSNLGELEVLEMDELEVSGSSTAHTYLVQNEGH